MAVARRTMVSIPPHGCACGTLAEASESTAPQASSMILSRTAAASLPGKSWIIRFVLPDCLHRNHEGLYACIPAAEKSSPAPNLVEPINPPVCGICVS